MKVQFNKNEIEYPENTIPVEFICAYRDQALAEMVHCKDDPVKHDQYVFLRKTLKEMIENWENIVDNQ